MSVAASELVVVALGGNAVSPPRGGLSFAVERELIARAAAELAPLAVAGARLLIVHGNGPQVGRLLSSESADDPADLDLLVAQTQGEMGYLLAEALAVHLGAAECAALITRVVVDERDPGFAQPTKPVGRVLAQPPAGAAVQLADGSGWRRVVASPRPLDVVELDTIRRLLATTHVIAGGGGGIALVRGESGRQARPAVVDKDWTAALLATRLDAHRLLYVTDVAQVCDDFGTPGQRPIATMTAAAARARLAAGAFPPGSMGPKIASAVAFVEASGRPAVIATLGAIAAALRGDAGTTIA
ncbi:MAG TPA: carbamate kinase [Candidatus Dormibacteraeota bacterium]|nr:carbamate kinase [Candidatus Dormibacteraeota bacterium]